MPARSIGTATISFGLVSIPVKLYSTVDTTAAIRFNYLSKDGSRLKQQYIRASDGEVVERQERIQGYEFAKGQYVTFTEEELKALNVAATNAIDIAEFIPLAEVERLYIERVYYLGPDKGAARSYHLLKRALSKTGRAALANYAARGRSYLVLVRQMGEGLVMEQLKYQQELRPFDEVPLDTVDVADAELEGTRFQANRAIAAQPGTAAPKLHEVLLASAHVERDVALAQHLGATDARAGHAVGGDIFFAVGGWAGENLGDDRIQLVRFVHRRIRCRGRHVGRRHILRGFGRRRHRQQRNPQRGPPDTIHQPTPMRHCLPILVPCGVRRQGVTQPLHLRGVDFLELAQHAGRRGEAGTNAMAGAEIVHLANARAAHVHVDDHVRTQPHATRAQAVQPRPLAAHEQQVALVEHLNVAVVAAAEAALAAPVVFGAQRVGEDGLDVQGGFGCLIVHAGGGRQRRAAHGAGQQATRPPKPALKHRPRRRSAGRDAPRTPPPPTGRQSRPR